MTLPYWNGVRCALDYVNSDGADAGSRFYLSYSGSSPSGANCITLANDVVTAWNTHIAAFITLHYTLNEVDVVDLSSDVAASGQSNTTSAGTGPDPAPPTNVAINVEYDIARRYRGGKPRMYFPPSPNDNLADQSHWASGLITSFNAAVGAFFAEIEALTIGSMGTLDHVNVSYYHGFDKNQPPAGKWRGPGYKYPPLPRSTPLFDSVEGYSTKALVGSQRRRRAATTP